jgi:predicted dehydrogenase
MWKVALCGTGMISDWFVQSAKQVEGIQVVAVHSRHLETAQEFASKNTIEKTYTEYDLMFNDPEIDMIYIGLPNSLHFEVALKALKAKKHVIVEKPFTSNMTEFIQLVQVAFDNGVKLFEMNRVLQLPNYQVIREHLKDIAPIRLITWNYSQYSRKYNDLLAGNVRNVFTSEFSGGALVDLGVYGVHFVTGLFGAPQDITYVATQLPNTIDTSGALTLKYDGYIASLVQSKNSKAENRITVQGEKGTLTVSGTPWILDQVELDTDHKELVNVSQPLNPMAYNLIEFIRILNENDETAYRAQLDHIQAVQLILDEARKSAGIVYDADKKVKKHWFSFKPKAVKPKKEKAVTPKKEKVAKPKKEKTAKPKKEKAVKAKKEKPVKAKKDKA